MLQRYGRPLVWAALAAAATGAAHGAVDFEQQIRPILEQNCVSCHGAAKVRGNLRLDSQEAALQGGKSGPVVVPGKPAESRLFRVIEMSPDEEGAMPPDGPQLPKALRELIRAWIAEGAVWPAGVTLIDRTAVANTAGAGRRPTPAELVAREHAVVNQLHARIVA